PLALLILLLVTAAIAFRSKWPFRRAWIPLAFSIGILLVGLTSHINIGVRHILPIYMGLALVAAAGAVQLVEEPMGRTWKLAGLGLLGLWLAGSSLLAHPDYIPYFNELAGSEPEKILVDSDLDWGQDAKRLSERLRELGVPAVTFMYYVQGDYQKEHGF